MAPSKNAYFWREWKIKVNDIQQETINTYNKSAKALSVYFQGIGSRVDDIDRAFKLADCPTDARVVEIGCGDGRDAREIIKHTNQFTGFDISEELIKLANQSVPGVKFVVADAREYAYPRDLDIVFAFASLLHLDKNEVKKVLGKVKNSLRPRGIVYISLKYSDVYMEKVKEDEYGKRLFYFYNPDLIQELAGSAYKTVYVNQETIGQTEWFDIALQKK